MLLSVFIKSVCVMVGAFLLGTTFVLGQTAPPTTSSAKTLDRYLDQTTGVTADDAVRIALENNGELQAMRKEVEAARALVKQAGLRPNPKVKANRAEQVGGMDSQLMVEGMLPLELGGRRGARIRVAQVELEIRELALANQERLIAGEVRSKFGEALAQIKKLELIEKLLGTTQEGYQIIAARVTEGRTAPLEGNMSLVEVNRLKSMSETSAGKAETALFELKNLLAMKPEDPLRLRGDFDDLIAPPPSLDEAVTLALRERPDLQGARATERLAAARIEQARAEGRIDASLTAGYQRMNSGFPLNGITDTGELRPIQSIFNFFTLGVEFDLPVRNRNQGAVEAAVFEREAARRRVEFGELTIRREVNTAFVRYNRAARSFSIFQTGVRDQAEANLRVVWQTYELGKRTVSDYIAEQRRFLEVEDELVDAALETYLARVEILRSTNSPDLK